MKKKRIKIKPAPAVSGDAFGRVTAAARVGRSLVPVGVYPFDLPPYSESTPRVDATAPGNEQYLMNIVGTAMQAGDGKLITCAHVTEGLLTQHQKSRHYMLARLFREGAVLFVPYPIEISIPFIDDQTGKPNPKVDAAVIISSAKSTAELPYEVPNIKWGDSTKLGVGDAVIVGGYPYGEQMCLFTQSNRGIVQPTFYSGIISAILPITQPGETRLLQISIPVAGGMSGGAVFIPYTGEVVGMVTSCMHINQIPQPMSYAIPSEVLAPFAEAISYRTEDGTMRGVGS
jgi:hypothetical protein